MSSGASSKSVALLIGLALLTGCGGGGGSSEPEATTVTTSEMTKAQYVSRGDEICKKGYARIAQKLSSAAEGELTVKQREALIADDLLPVYKEMIDELHALGAPAGDASQLNTMFHYYYKGISEVEQDPARAISGVLPFDAGNNRAWRYGLKACRA